MRAFVDACSGTEYAEVSVLHCRRTALHWLKRLLPLRERGIVRCLLLTHKACSNQPQDVD